MVVKPLKYKRAEKLFHSCFYGKRNIKRQLSRFMLRPLNKLCLYRFFLDARGGLSISRKFCQMTDRALKPIQIKLCVF